MYVFLLNTGFCSRMFRLISCVLLYSTLTMGYPFPFPAAPVVPPTAVIPTPYPFVPGATPVVPTATPYGPGISPVVPTAIPYAPGVKPVVPSAIPFVPGARPIVPGANNPYYNYARAPAIPILSYSSEHGLDGTYAFRFVFRKVP